MAPGLLVSAFFLEPQAASPERPLTSYGIFALALGFYKLAGFNHISEEDYPDVMNLKNMWVLILTDTGKQEHENLIKLARDVDERGRGLRLFWFARVQDFDIERPKSLFREVWRTPVQGDGLRLK